MRLPDGWTREDRGWYTSADDALSVVWEGKDGWAVYDWGTDPTDNAPPVATYPTLAAALLAITTGQLGLRRGGPDTRHAEV